LVSGRRWRRDGDVDGAGKLLGRLAKENVGKYLSKKLLDPLILKKHF